MPCSHCKQIGHNYRKCPQLSDEEKKNIYLKNKKKKDDAVDRRQRIEAHRLQLQIKVKVYEFINDSNHELAVYWMSHTSNIMKHLCYISNRSSHQINCYEDHRICIFHTLQVTNPEDPSQVIPEINMDAIDDGIVVNDGNTPLRYHPVFNKIMKDSHENIIILTKEFKPIKSELEKWKESSLKSKYLLEQIIKLGGKQIDNLEPILDMVQDINVPEHTDYDKEFAGIPSILTNIT